MFFGLARGGVQPTRQALRPADFGGQLLSGKPAQVTDWARVAEHLGGLGHTTALRNWTRFDTIRPALHVATANASSFGQIQRTPEPL